MLQSQQESTHAGDGCDGKQGVRDIRWHDEKHAQQAVDRQISAAMKKYGADAVKLGQRQQKRRGSTLYISDLPETASEWRLYAD